MWLKLKHNHIINKSYDEIKYLKTSLSEEQKYNKKLTDIIYDINKYKTKEKLKYKRCNDSLLIELYEFKNKYKQEMIITDKLSNDIIELTNTNNVLLDKLHKFQNNYEREKRFSDSLINEINILDDNIKKEKTRNKYCIKKIVDLEMKFERNLNF